MYLKEKEKKDCFKLKKKKEKRKKKKEKRFADMVLHAINGEHVGTGNMN
jgi:hypothetical protein